jgi:hypothetical protein
MAKKHSTINIKNPTSMQHIVRMKPGQLVLLKVDKQICNDCNLIVNGDYLNYYKSRDSDSIQFTIVHKDIVRDWSKRSTTFLGEIVLVNGEMEKCDVMAKLMMFLELTDKDAVPIVSVINPVENDVRIWPGELLEVVLFEESWPDDIYWSWKWSPAMGVCVDLLKKDSLEIRNAIDWDYLDETACYMYEMYPRSPLPRRNHYHTQYHFWFRFDKKIIDLMSVQTGIWNLGDFLFLGTPTSKRSSESYQFKLNVYCNLVEDKKTDAIKSFLIPDDDPLMGWDRLQKDKVEFSNSNLLRHKYVPLVERHFYQPMSKFKFERKVDVSFLGKMDLEDNCIVISSPQQQLKSWIQM